MTQTEDQTATGADEMFSLKARARLMGIQFSNNIGLEALRLKINAKLAELEPEEDEPAVAETVVAAPVAEKPKTRAQLEMEMRAKLMAEATKLVRLRITNLNPNKRDLPGEIFTVANEFIGTISKYIPFGAVTDDGYHVPYCLYEMMRDKQFVNLRTTKGRNGQDKVEDGWAKEFALEVLPQLTPQELERLRNAQAAANNTDD